MSYLLLLQKIGRTFLTRLLLALALLQQSLRNKDLVMSRHVTVKPPKKSKVSIIYPLLRVSVYAE